MRFKFLFSILILIILNVGCATQFKNREVERIKNLSVEHFRNTITINDDGLESVAMISTQNGYSVKHGLLNIVWNDLFLRGFIDKKTGVKSYQVYVSLTHQNNQWLNPYQVNYGKPLQTTSTIKVHSDVNCSSSKYVGCTYFEHFTFKPEISELRRVEKAKPEDYKSKRWVLRIKTQAGKDIEEFIPLPEVAAFMEAMDGYKPLPTN
jgi:hypothetical protein